MSIHRFIPHRPCIKWQNHRCWQWHGFPNKLQLLKANLQVTRITHRLTVPFPRGEKLPNKEPPTSPILPAATLPMHKPKPLPKVAHTGTERPKVRIAGGKPTAAPTKPPTAEPLAPPKDPIAKPPFKAHETIASIWASCVSSSPNLTNTPGTALRALLAAVRCVSKVVSPPRWMLEVPLIASISTSCMLWQIKPPAVPIIMPPILPMPALIGTDKPKVNGAGMMPERRPTKAPLAPPAMAPKPLALAQRLPLDIAERSTEIVAASECKALRKESGINADRWEIIASTSLHSTKSSSSSSLELSKSLESIESSRTEFKVGHTVNRTGAVGLAGKPHFPSRSNGSGGTRSCCGWEFSIWSSSESSLSLCTGS